MFIHIKHNIISLSANCCKCSYID